MTTNRNAPSKVCMTALATTPQRNSRRGVTIAILLVVAQLVTGSGCGKATKKDEDEKAARRQAAEQRIAELAKKHGANTNWIDSIKSKSDYSKVFSFQCQEAFDPLIGHPILFIANIVDVCRAQDGYRLICQFSLDSPQFFHWEKTYFVLDLPQEKALQLANIGDAWLFADFAVVAVPSRVDVKFNRELSIDDASVSVGELSGELWIKGTCLEVEHVPGY